MTASRRTFVAFVIAPCVALLEYAMVAATTRPAGEGPSWFASFLMWLIAAAIPTYFVVLLSGVIVFGILRVMRKESRVRYTSAGVLAGIAFASLLRSQDEPSSPSPWHAALFVGIFAVIGASVGGIFGVLHIKKNAQL
jgi:hypothetical protein